MKRHKVNPKSLANLRRPWKKGEVPNPTGVNKKRPLTDEYWQASQRAMPDAIVRRFNRQCGARLLELGVTWAEGVAMRLHFEAVMEGSTRAARELREAIEGKSPQRLEISGPERKEVTLEVHFVTRDNGLSPEKPKPTTNAVQ